MTPERWEEIRALFVKIVDLEPGQQAERLATISETDPELRAEVESLLAAHEETGDVLGVLEELSPLRDHAAAHDQNAVSAPADPYGLVGQTVSHYEVQELLGGGGMGVLYKAIDRQLDRTVALKFLPPQWSLDAGFKERFSREARAAAALEHTHVCNVHEIGETEEGQLFIAMAFYEGETVKQKLARGPLEIDEALGLAGQAASGLAAAHAQGIVHRDIKPANLIVAEDGVLKILDFGIAKTADLTLTGPGLKLGTVAYMSPEQTRGDEVDQRTDLWSLGVVLYEMLTGRRPFRGESDRIVVQAIRHEKPTPPAQLRKHLAPELQEIVLRLLSKEPEGRDAGADRLLGRSVPSPFVRLLNEIHRRSVWQVLAGWGMASWVIVELAGTLADLVGLPLWFGRGLLLVLLAILPLLLFTGFVRGRRAAALGAGEQRWLTWRNAGLASALALVLLATATGAYMTMRSLGIGPAGTLIARDELQAQSQIVLADFAAAPEDSALARTVTEALRIDLSESPTFTLAEPGRVRELLALMERPQQGPFDLETAREVAIRGGMPTVIGGEVRRAGAGYVLTAQLLSPEPQRALISRRETAANDDELIPAIDRLSKGLRERIGEPLRSLRQAQPLPEVTTGSLEALQKYAQAGIFGDRSIRLLEEAIALDSGFAMAWRRLGVVLNNEGEERTRQVQALTQAFEQRDRLPERERYIVEATYYRTVMAEYEKAIEAHEDHLAAYPNDRNRFDMVARHSMAIEYMGLRRHERAEEILRLLIHDYPSLGSGSRCWTAHWVLVQAQVALGKFEDAYSTAEDCNLASLSADSIPYDPRIVAWIAAAQGDYQTALDLFRRAEATTNLADISAVRGQLAEAERLGPDEALAIATRDLFTRRDARRAVQGIQAALEKAPLADMDPDPLDRPYLELAALYAQAGRTDLAQAIISEFESVVEPRLRGPQRAEYARARGELALAEGRYEDAIAEFRASDIGQCLTCAFPGLIRTYDAVGEPDSVMALLERYLATPHMLHMQVDHAYLGPALERLGQLYDERGDRENAAKHYARFVELWADADPELQPRVRAAQLRLDEIVPMRG